MKQIIATTLSGLFVKDDAWKHAHKLLFETIASKLKDKGFLKWVDRPDYFTGVDIAMTRMYPRLSDTERTVKSRQLYFKSVLDYIKTHDVANKPVISYFRELSKEFSLVLVTTTSQDAVQSIVKSLKLDFFDCIFASSIEEKDDSRTVMRRMVSERRILAYIGTGRQETINFCEKNSIKYILVDFGNKNAKISNLTQLKQAISLQGSQKQR